MTGRRLVDPELLPVLDRLPNVQFSIETLPATREAVERAVSGAPTDSHAVESRSLVLPTRSGHELRALYHRPEGVSADLPVLFWIHGGGLVMGTPAMMAAEHRAMAAALQCAIFAPGPRLAPETPHPGPIEDLYDALFWLHAESEVLGIDPNRIAVCGRSSGGGLAAALALMARDRGGPAIAYQYLHYPMLDDRTGTSREPGPYAGEFAWTAQHNAFAWRALLGSGAGGADVSPYAAAARETDLSGLPPAYISVGALDLFVDECLDYGRRLMRAGVPSELHIWPGAFHASGMASEARISIAAETASRAALTRALGL